MIFTFLAGGLRHPGQALDAEETAASGANAIRIDGYHKEMIQTRPIWNFFPP
jgi:hypothetical protein